MAKYPHKKELESKARVDLWIERAFMPKEVRHRTKLHPILAAQLKEFRDKHGRNWVPRFWPWFYAAMRNRGHARAQGLPEHGYRKGKPKMNSYSPKRTRRSVNETF